MSPSNRVEKFLHTHGIAWSELTLQEQHHARLDQLETVKGLLQDRGVQLCPGLQLAKPAVADEWASEYFQEPWPAEERQGISIPVEDWDLEFNTDWDGVLPSDAELFFDDGEFAFYRTSPGDIYITESPSDSVTEDEVDIRTMIRVLDNMTFVLEEIRTNLVRNL